MLAHDILEAGRRRVRLVLGREEARDTREPLQGRRDSDLDR